MGGVVLDNNEVYDLENSPSLNNWGEAAALPQQDVAIECGWGRLLFAHTFDDHKNIVSVLQGEAHNARDLALYVRDPQVLISLAPQDLFIDPSFTYRLALDAYEPLKPESAAFSIRLLQPDDDIECINRIYQSHNMVPIDTDFLLNTYKGRFIKYWVVIDDVSSDVLGVCMGIDHKMAFDDPENGASLWSVAVDPQAAHAGIGLQMVQHVAAFYQEQGRAFMDLSVMHSNEGAIALYEKLGFVKVPVFGVKRKNPINETLYTAPEPETSLTPYATIIINEARRRGIRVGILDEEDNYFELTKGGTTVICHESLTELTSSIAMSKCRDKAITLRFLERAGLRVPQRIVAGTPADNHAFLKAHECLVVKPAIGEEGSGITVNVKTRNELETAILNAKAVSQKVLLEAMHSGQDLRVVVIDYKVVAASYRTPPVIVGDGKQSIMRLVEKLSRRRQQATGGMSKIPVDRDLRRLVHHGGYTMDDVLPAGEALQVRKEPNLKFGGTMEDVTEILHPAIRDAAEEAARVLNVPVVGFDMIVKAADKQDYYILGANERPGLANHEPQPTAERFIDLLFPQSVAREVEGVD